MNIHEAQDILYKNGFILESSIKGDFTKGEKGGEPYFNLSNDYSYSDAKRIFIEAKYGKKNSDESLIDVWNNYINQLRKNNLKKLMNSLKNIKMVNQLSYIVAWFL